METKEKLKSGILPLVVLASIVGSLNVLFATNFAISVAVVGVELAILLYFLIKKEITKYIGNYMIFLCLSFEFDYLVNEQFYGFKNFRILGVNLGIVALLPILFLVISKKIKIKELKETYPRISKFIKLVLLMNITGIIFGLIQILINDNAIQNMDNFMGDFINVSYSMVAIPLLMIIAFVYIVIWEKDRINELENYLVAILIGVIASMIVSRLSGNYGWYGGVKTLLVTNIIRYIPFMLLFPFYKKCKMPKLAFVFGLIGAALTLMYNATGKMIILYIMIPMGIAVVLWKKKKIIPLLLLLLMMPIVAIISMNAAQGLASGSILFNSKLNEAMAMLKFWEPNWLTNMPLSPLVRITEFIDIFLEYMQKPWFVFFGKGYMGTITDHIGFLGTTYIPGSFSINQWDNATFYGVHETLNILFLYHGLFGIWVYLYMIKSIFSDFSKNIWILIGGFWFVMIYGFSVTMSTFGIAALLLGYIQIDRRRDVLE